MSKTHSIFLLLFIILTWTSLTQLPTSQAAEYTTVTTITGSATQTTATFPITSNAWRLQWSYTPDSSYPEYAGFHFFIYPKGETALYTGMFIADGDSQTSGTEYVYKGNDNYYLKIGAANLQSYTITIQQETQPTQPPTQQPTQPANNLGGNTGQDVPVIMYVFIALLLIVAVGAIIIVKISE